MKFSTWLNGLVADASPDGAADYVVTYDASATTSKKVLLDNLPGGSGVGSLTDWTPTVTQSGSVAVTINYAKYMTIGGLYYITANLDVTGSGTGGNAVTIGGLPVNPASGGAYGIAYINDSGTAFYVGALIIFSSTNVVIRVHGVTGNAGVTPNFALASGDNIWFTATYPGA